MTPDLQTSIAAIKAECEEIIRLDKRATAGPWMPHSISDEHSTFDFIDDGDYAASSACMHNHNARFIAHSRNVSPAMARVIVMTVRYAEDTDDKILLLGIAEQWEGK